MDQSPQWPAVLTAADATRPAADRGRALRLAVELGGSVLPVSLGCSITERVDSGYRSVSTANELSLALDRAQYDADEGPCLIAAAEGIRQHADIVADRDRFPVYAGAALTRGVRSSLSLPVPLPGRMVAMNLYAATPDAFASHTEAVAGLLARCVANLLPSSVVVVQAGYPDEVEARRARMQAAVRAVMDAEGTTREAAFAGLARQSGTERRSVHSIAEGVLVDAGLMRST